MCVDSLSIIYRLAKETFEEKHQRTAQLRILSSQRALLQLGSTFVNQSQGADSAELLGGLRELVQEA